MTIVAIFMYYIFIGLGVAIAYMYDVGKQISQKYGCGLMEGIYRFEKAGSMMSNIKAVMWIILIWPKLYVSMKTGVWHETLAKMVDENDY